MSAPGGPTWGSVCGSLGYVRVLHPIETSIALKNGTRTTQDVVAVAPRLAAKLVSCGQTIFEVGDPTGVLLAKQHIL